MVILVIPKKLGELVVNEILWKTCQIVEQTLYWRFCGLQSDKELVSYTNVGKPLRRHFAKNQDFLKAMIRGMLVRIDFASIMNATISGMEVGQS